MQAISNAVVTRICFVVMHFIFDEQEMKRAVRFSQARGVNDLYFAEANSQRSTHYLFEMFYNDCKKSKR
jgi:hypothetical protein